MEKGQGNLALHFMATIDRSQGFGFVYDLREVYKACETSGKNATRPARKGSPGNRS